MHIRAVTEKRLHKIFQKAKQDKQLEVSINAGYKPMLIRIGEEEGWHFVGQHSPALFSDLGFGGPVREQNRMFRYYFRKGNVKV